MPAIAGMLGLEQNIIFCNRLGFLQLCSFMRKSPIPPVLSFQRKALNPEFLEVALVNNRVISFKYISEVAVDGQFIADGEMIIRKAAYFFVLVNGHAATIDN